MVVFTYPGEFKRRINNEDILPVLVTFVVGVVVVDLKVVSVVIFRLPVDYKLLFVFIWNCP